MTNFLEALLDNKTSRVKVEQWIEGRWVVNCGICCTDFLAIMSAPWSHDWRTTYDWALMHAKHHEEVRCKDCGYSPPLDEYVNYVKNAQERNPN